MSGAPAGPVARLAVIGPGAYGRSLAAWAARCGVAVRLVGRNAAHAQAGRARILEGWDAAVARGRMAEAERERAQALLGAAASLEGALEETDAALEALPEDLTVKARFWRVLAPWEGLALSGSSSIPMGALALAAGHPGPLLGFHGFVPLDRSGVIELAVPAGAAASKVERARDLAARLCKRVVEVRDQAGFAASRMALAQGLEAMRLLEAGAADRDGLDALMVLGYGHPAGPLELSDRVGLDLRLAIADRIHDETGLEAFRAPALLRDLVAAGRTGRAAGRGFYEWDGEGRKR